MPRSSAITAPMRGTWSGVLRCLSRHVGGNVGRVGLDDERVERQLPGEPPDLPRALERHVAAEAELEPLREIRVGLLEAAVERMRDAAPHARAPQPGQHAILRFAHVAHDRQIELAREPQLRVIEELLAALVEPRHEVVETDLADADEARIVEARLDFHAQPVEVFVARMRRVHRMNAERIHRAARRMRERAHRREVRAPDARNHDARHARRPRRAGDDLAVGVELRRIEMAMRVDPHRVTPARPAPRAARRRAAAGCGRSARRDRDRA